MPFQYDTFNAQPAVGRIADLMQQGGQIQANAALNRGQGRAQMGQTIAQGAGQAIGTIGQLFQQQHAAKAQQAQSEAIGRVLHQATNEDGTYDPVKLQAGAQEVGLPPQQTQSLLDWTDKKNQSVLATAKARQDLKPKPEKIGTRQVTVKNADGSESVQIVPDTPGQTFTSAAPPKADKIETRSLDVQAADALARGDTDTYKRLLQVKKEMGQADDRPPRITVNTGLSANVPGDWDQTGDAFLKTIPAQWRKTVEKIARYEEDPTKVASMRGGMREALTQWVNQVNPSYDQSNFAIRNPTRKAYTTGTQGQQIVAMNTAIGHIDQLQGVAAALGNGSFKPGNALWNSVKTTFGASAPTNFDTLKDALSGEVASVLSKGGATVSGIADAKEKISTANSPKQLADYVQTLIPVMGSKLNELNYAYHQAMGEDDPYQAISPEAAAILTRRGFDPKHPTVATAAKPAAGAGRMRVKGPNGETGTIPSDAVLPSGWVKQ